jgi:hypothetical protein
MLLIRSKFNWAAVLLYLSMVCANASPLSQSDLQSVWEVLWDQTGYPRTLSFWKKDEKNPVTYAVTGFNAARHQATIEEALQEINTITGLRFKSVAFKEEQEKPNLLFEITPNNNQNTEMPCYAQSLEWRASHSYRRKVVMREELVWDCLKHELMHAMGLSGHPSGNTVLSYFPRRQDVLSDLDKLMLRAVYSGKMTTFATPFEALPVLTQELLSSARLTGSQQEEAEQQVQSFELQIVREMERFASGKGEIPPIIRRSGRASEETIKEARSAMAYYLGTAYEQGDIVDKDVVSALKWFDEGARQGDSDAMAALGIYHFYGHGMQANRNSGWLWLSKAAKAGSKYAEQQLEKISKETNPEELAKLQKLH